MNNIEALRKKAKFARYHTIRIHGIAPETRIASSLSAVEIFVALYYGKILRFNPSKPLDCERDRFIISKGHGSISLYPILSDLGFFGFEELDNIGTKESALGVIPDCQIAGYETINGSLGHGLGVASGIALALKRKGLDREVFVLLGDGELNEGSVWEAIMFASKHKLDNLSLIIDNNKISMLGKQEDIMGLCPLDEKFEAFKFSVRSVDGHDIEQLYNSMDSMKKQRDGRAKVLIANTCKGKGVESLEGDLLSHIRSLKSDDVEKILESWK